LNGARRDATAAVAADGTVACGETIQGQGRIISVDANQLAGSSGEVVTVPGLITVTHYCDTPDTPGQYALLTGPDYAVNAFIDNGGADPQHANLAANTAYGSNAWATAPTGDEYVFSFEAVGWVATMHLFNSTWTNNFLHQSGCAVQGYAVVHGA